MFGHVIETSVGWLKKQMWGSDDNHFLIVKKEGGDYRTWSKIGKCWPL